MSKKLEDKIYTQKRLLDSNQLDRKKSPFNFNIYETRNSPEKLNQSNVGKYFNSYYQKQKPYSHLQNQMSTFLQNDYYKKQTHSFQQLEPYKPKQYVSVYDKEQPEKKRFQLSDMFSLRPQSPTIFSKKHSYAEYPSNNQISHSRNQSPIQYSIIPQQSPLEKSKKVLAKHASDYIIGQQRPLSEQWLKREATQQQRQDPQRSTKFEIERLRMELEQYKLSKRTNNSSFSRINDGYSINNYASSKENNNFNVKNFTYAIPKRDITPKQEKLTFHYIGNQQQEFYQKLQPSAEKQALRVSRSELGNIKKQPYQLNNQLSDHKRFNERKQTPETNRVEELRKQLYSTYKSDKELFFESLNKSTPYNKSKINNLLLVANQRELQQSSNFRDQIKYKLDKKFI